jgi:hypothetical protein
MLVILRPAPKHRIQLHKQVACEGLLVTLHDPAEGVQEAPHVRLGWWTEELSVILAHAGAKKVTPLLNVRDPRLLSRECQAPFREKLVHTWLHFLFQAGFGAACEDEIIRTPAHVDFRPCGALEGRKGLCDVPL